MSNFHTLTVYLGSGGFTRPVFKDAARDLGRLMVERNKHLVYGGMDAGLMGLMAQSCLTYGGHVTGIIPKRLKDSERVLSGLTETVYFDTLAQRKLGLFHRADAIFVMPGGYGTLDEALECLYWATLGLHAKPVIFLNLENYWDPAIEYLSAMKDATPFYQVAESLDHGFEFLEQWGADNNHKNETQDFPNFEEELYDNGTEEPLIFDQADLVSSYQLITALGLKQLGKILRPIGIVNDSGQYDDLLTWIDRAAQEKFITENCPLLLERAATHDKLIQKLLTAAHITVDLHGTKWGKPVDG